MIFCYSNIAFTLCSQNSEILYIVFITINIAIFTLYVVFCLIWLHLSFTVRNLRSRGILEA
jgi:hypothetical protein